MGLKHWHVEELTQLFNMSHVLHIDCGSGLSHGCVIYVHLVVINLSQIQ